VIGAKALLGDQPILPGWYHPIRRRHSLEDLLTRNDKAVTRENLKLIFGVAGEVNRYRPTP